MNVKLGIGIVSLLLSCFAVKAQHYTSYKNLVMAGYQGWFTAAGDPSGRTWHHYGGTGFGPEHCSIDFWPDMSEYTHKYLSPFTFADGSPAYLFSSYDEETVDLHFKWMKEYGIDGVFLQRFVSEVKRPAGKQHFNKVLANALKAAKKYDRAVCIMYDLSGYRPEDNDFVMNDWEELQHTFSLSDVSKNPTYLHHNGKPLLAIWGVGFNDNRPYRVADIRQLISGIKKSPDTGSVSIMLGVPYYWRSLDRDTENNPELHELIRQSDIIMPWSVGRYNSSSYTNQTLEEDVLWCRENKVDYVPLVFPGFSWGNLKRDRLVYNQLPRFEGDFLWQQIAGARSGGAEMLYVAMFDEIDEGTAIFKCAKEGDLPLNGEGRFVGIEENLDSDYYLWLTGQASKWFKGDSRYNDQKPQRK